MIEKYDAVAKRSGAKIILASGYGSIPFDLGALHASNELEAKHGLPPSEVIALVTRSRGYLSGGSLASASITFKGCHALFISPLASCF